MRKMSEMFSVTPNFSAKILKPLLLVTTVVALAACSKPGGPPPRNSGPAEVLAYTVEKQKVPLSSELTGRVVAAVTAEIRPQTSGIVLNRLFTEGSEVEAGQLLYEIDSSSAQTTVSDAEATLASANVALASAKAKAVRYRELVDIEAVSQESAEEADVAYKQAISTVDSAKANLESAKLSLSYSNVTSPIKGQIGRSTVSKGALVTANQTDPLATVQQLDSVYLDATQSASKFLKIREQFRTGEVQLDNASPVVRLIKNDGSLYELAGTLGLEDAVVDETTGTVTVRSLFPNPNRELIPGMYGKIRIEGAILQDALVVPQVAISRDVKGNALAYVIGDDNVIEERMLTTGATVGDQWIVESGLKAGERIVVEGLQKIQAGSVVNVANDDKSVSTQAPSN
ncbi:efflux RND transporter periplasmic adaptor subunit [Alteromonas sp. 5E99-2]|uniref:efflux RND transporter periplasmic adaptor subunit n=1 Tax=Alteromonas sp. 5E99-2 TaxID=2817683 RepID=UPI001A97F0A6|nr:efflux RND transporter periplasmic adaptor subunit [Alteromonas sp. 5E99-2]MBO1254819.1 efflux RND transporter periplasmic adaptor subunit [Alteromonas sp. 5E99-2]